MFNINKNKSIKELEVILEKSFTNKIDYMPQEFQEEQMKAFEVFKKRVRLEKTIEETITFNKELIWPEEEKSLNLTKTAEELIKVFKLRSDVYTSLNYNSEFPDIIEGLNFDNHDLNSAIIYNKTNGEISSTCRLIFDSHKKLPIEEKLNFDYIRKKHGQIGEVSRLIVKHNTKGLNLDFKHLTKGIYLILLNNTINATISVISKEHFKLYSKFGGFEIEKELSSYGNLNAPFVITSWDYHKVSKFFKKAFLN